MAAALSGFLHALAPVLLSNITILPASPVCIQSERVKLQEEKVELLHRVVR